MKEKSTNKSTFLENKKIITIAIIGSIIILTAIFLFKFDYMNLDKPEGVGEPNTDHAHVRFLIFIENRTVDTSAARNPDWVRNNDYIFLDEVGIIHKIAQNATIGMFFDSIGITLEEECLALHEGAKDIEKKPFEKLQYCNDGDTKVRTYISSDLKNWNSTYVPQDHDYLIIRYDDNNATKRFYQSPP